MVPRKAIGGSVLAALAAASEPMTLGELAEMIGQPRAQVETCLTRLLRARTVDRVRVPGKTGRRWCAVRPVTPVTAEPAAES